MTDIEDQAEQPQPLNSAPPQGPVEGRGVAEIRALCDAATPGPWFVASREGDDEGWWIWADRDEPFTVALLAYDGPDDTTDGERELADAAFIAAARDLVPQLLTEVEAADRFEQSAAVEREALLAERRKVTADWELACELLGQRTSELERLDRANAKLALDFAAVSVERDSLRGVVQAVEARAVRARDEATEYARRLVNAMDGDEALVGALARGFHDGWLAALAAAADAPQPPDAKVTPVTPNLSTAMGSDPLTWSRKRQPIAAGGDCDNTAPSRSTVAAGPSPAVLPEKEQRDV